MQSWRLSDTNPIGSFNPTTDRPVQPGQLDIGDAGQVGAGAAISGHGPGPGTMQYVIVDPRRTVQLPTDSPAHWLPGYRRAMGIVGGDYDDNLIWRDSVERGDSTNAPAYGDRVSGDPGVGVGMQSAPALANMPFLHGPTPDAEEEFARKGGKSITVDTRPFWKKVLGIAGEKKDSRDAFDEDIIPAVGRVLSEDTEIRPTDAAVAREIQFVLPDVRRTFDYDINPDTGYPQDKAGYTLTDTKLEPTPWKVTSRQRDPGFSVNIEDPVMVLDRVRAGVASPLPLAEDSNFSQSQARPARKWGPWLYDAKTFDNYGMTQNLTGMKGIMKNPFASRPIFTIDEQAAGDLSAFTAGPSYVTSAPGMDAGTTIHPNTDRMVPPAWDASLVDSGNPDNPDSGIQASAAQANRGFRLA
jgi:hypothetical protein